ncbi:high affinity nitrate transporter 2.7-like [Mangifera indica]|uniref:high affinity nitrate transporter 2.7-like n=1 Tax=Mangifera indica TaxID=29780 RepID=UPI001CFBCD69|nr:high affinity nitrate transporter 2.7-like [Mangifera indica]
MEAPPSPRKAIPPFNIPVDSDNKATQFHPFSLSSPHMLAFHLSWLSLFSCFFSTFSIPPLIPIIREDLKLSQADIGAAGIASFLGSIFSRLAMGPVCDMVGPRIASVTLSLLTAPIILATSLVSSPNSFILIRFLVGFSLANFVANQFWMSSMFSGCVVGLANGVSAGWANMGTGLAQFVMPLIFTAISYFNVPLFTAWRLAFIVPSMFQVLTAILVLIYGQDLPSGNYKDFKKARKNSKGEDDNFLYVLFNGLKNYRGWILALTYGYSFGVELTIDNIIAQYFYDRFNVNLQVAGTIAASFGLANWFSRPMGGVVSDTMGRKFGMRGRLWGLWVVQTAAGFLCVLLGRVNSLWSSIVVLCVFSVFVQAASGLTFGVVPFVSKRSLGVISGMTGSGGTVGAVVTQTLFFSGSEYSKQTSISLMGLMMIVCTLPLSLIYFPQWGGMFCAPSSDPDSAELQYLLLQ